MTVACVLPSDASGVALRLSGYLDCQGRALGENGFAAVAGGVAGGLLTGIVTIFIALIGYRLILGHVPGIRDGVTWMVRLGVVLALATSWPAFQTLIYRVAVDGPDELAAVLLPAAGLTTGTGGRIQAAYDALRLGTEVVPARAATPVNVDLAAGTSAATVAPAIQSAVQPRTVQPPLPQTASLLVVFTAGIGGALRVAIGLLLALGPLIVMGLLFDATLGLVAGWLRALFGAALALLAATIVTALEMTVLDGELARIGSLSGSLDISTFDPQALSTIVLLFGVVMLVATILASRVAGALRLSIGSTLVAFRADQAPVQPAMLPAGIAGAASVASDLIAARPPRAAAIADAVAGAARRQADASALNGDGPSLPSRVAPLAAARRDDDRTVVPLGIVGRRSQPRPSRTATLRDRTA